VTRLASHRGSISAPLLHTLLELPFVRIGVAHGTRTVLEAVQHGMRVFCGRPSFVSVTGGRSHMAFGENEARFFVSRQAKRRRPITLQVMALLAAVCVRCTSELALMLILVAVHTFGECNLVERVFTLRNMTFCAGHRSVLVLQGIGAGCVFFDSKKRWLESPHVMTSRAFDPGRALGKLPIVNVFVAVGAFLERQRLLEIPAGMALRAFDGLMLS